jgi:succinate dehydrogenase / fumarate reductase flavoprotein subunit
MSYPEPMQPSIEKLNATRQFRMTQQIPLLPPDQKQALLEGFHPDYKKGTMRELLLGPNKGDKTPHELANLFEAYTATDPAAIPQSALRTPQYDVDVLVIGGGGAGVSAALVAQAAGANVLLVTKLRVADANTTMAQGGIQAADKTNDSPAIHYLDVLGGGGYKNKPDLARALAYDAPAIIAWLEEMGVMFDKKPDGTMDTIHGGGTSRKRMHTCRDSTGLEIMRCLKDEMLNRKVPVIEYNAAVELILEAQNSGTPEPQNPGTPEPYSRCCGAVLLDLENSRLRVVRAKATIIATGGSGRLHVQGFPTTNHYGATADGLVLAYRAGAKLAFIDTIQYHPTGVAFPTQIVGQLITEKVRSVGAQLTNVEGNRFIYELETRDCTASAIIRECQERNLGIKTPTGDFGVWLDTPLIELLKGPGTIQKQLPAMYRQFINFGIDMTKEPILTYPTQHYQNGGILIDDKGETTVKGLYAAGEAAGGIHGRNRLMGNSLLDILVFGRRAGVAASESARQSPKSAIKLSLDHAKKYNALAKELGFPKDRKAPILLPDYRPEPYKGHFTFFEHR